MQSIPKRFLAFTYAERMQTPKRIIQIINKFLAIFCTVLCNRHQFYSFTFLRIHSLPKYVMIMIYSVLKTLSTLDPTFLLSSKTVFMFSIQTASTGPSKIIHLRSGVPSDACSRNILARTPKILFKTHFLTIMVKLKFTDTNSERHMVSMAYGSSCTSFCVKSHTISPFV